MAADIREALETLLSRRMVDALLEDMLRDARNKLQDYFGSDLWEADIDWDRPAQFNGDTWTQRDAIVSHAIGFISGCAAALDVTPLTLLDEIRDVNDPEVARELHVEAAKLEGTVIEVESVAAARPLRPDPAYLPSCRRNGGEPCSVHAKKWNNYQDRCGRPATPKKPRKTKRSR